MSGTTSPHCVMRASSAEGRPLRVQLVQRPGYPVGLDLGAAVHVVGDARADQVVAAGVIAAQTLGAHGLDARGDVGLGRLGGELLEVRWA